MNDYAFFKLDNNVTSSSQNIGEVPIHFSYFFKSIYYFFGGKEGSQDWKV